MSARSGASFSASAAARISLRSLRANDIGGLVNGRPGTRRGGRPFKRWTPIFVQRIKARRKQFAQCSHDARQAWGQPEGRRPGRRPTPDSWTRPRPFGRRNLKKFGAEPRAQGGRILQLAFVDRQRPPAHRRQCRRRGVVAGAVAGDLGVPRVGIGLGQARPDADRSRETDARSSVGHGRHDSCRQGVYVGSAKAAQWPAQHRVPEALASGGRQKADGDLGRFADPSPQGSDGLCGDHARQNRIGAIACDMHRTSIRGMKEAGTI